MSEAISPERPASGHAARREHVPLAILYMLGATIVFSGSSAISKWLVASYPIGEVLFTRTAVALVTVLGKEELVHESKNLGAPLELVQWVAEHGRLPVPNFSAGGIA